MSSANNLKIRMITWNMEGTSNKQKKDNWVSELKQFWTKVGDCSSTPFGKLGGDGKSCFDILLVNVQEDWRTSGSFGNFSEAIKDVLNAEENDTIWEMKKIEMEGAPDFIGKPFSVKLYMFYKFDYASVLTDAKFNFAKTCLKEKIKMCSKATVGISIYIPKTKTLLITMGSHLPVATDNEDMGYSKRVIAVKKSIDEVFKKLLNEAAKAENEILSVVSLWSGDMNYRRNTPVYAGNVVDDQLEYALSTEKLFNIDSLSKGTPKSFQEQAITFPPTCKLHSCNDQACDMCRQQKNWNGTINNITTTCYHTEGDKKREPSHCDRILFYSQGNATMIPVSYVSWAAAHSVQRSDHNLVWADFVLQM